ncbi:hypothetical protein VP1G_04572 [Cytospora mali]|uniref:Uncharacterized protein n=1 Tax=Cytospora mali TaxID=578113 RepID=A0A194V071_CYTMA|nr:hypothetical protein VP1G_04572 [Valsa mali var. pyri (nom. inval.)]
MPLKRKASSRTHFTTPKDGSAGQSPASPAQGEPEQGLHELPDRIAVPYVTAVVDWRDFRSDSFTFGAHWSQNRKKVFFKIRASVALKDDPNDTSIYLQIPSDSIEWLSVFPPNPILGPDLYTFRFFLIRRPTLVFPNIPEMCVGSDLASEETLKAFKIIARELEFTVYAVIPPKLSSPTQLTSLGDAVSHGAVSSLGTRKGLHSLYSGRGGREVEGDIILRNKEDQSEVQDSDLEPASKRRRRCSRLSIVQSVNDSDTAAASDGPPAVWNESTVCALLQESEARI